MRLIRSPWTNSLVALAAALLCAATLRLAPPAQAAPDGWKSEPIASSQNGSQKCAQLVFIGARGSGEAPGMSRTIKAVRDQIAEQPGVPKNVRQIYIDYPALSIDPSILADIETLLLGDDLTKIPYWDSTEKGVAEVKRVLLENVERCPNEKIVLVGFSQGAEAVNRGLSLAVKESPKVAENLVAALLMGNPGNYSTQNVQILEGEPNQGSGGLSTTLWYLRTRALDDQSSGFERVQGIVKGIFDLYENKVPAEELRPIMTEHSYNIPDEISARVYSVCNDGDMICNAIPALTRILSAQTSVNTELERSEPIHLSYPDHVQESVAAIGKAINQQATAKPSVSPENRPEETQRERAWIWWAAGGVGILAALGIFFGRGRSKAKQ